MRCSEIGERRAGEYRGDGFMRVHGAGTDILLVHRRVESGFSGDRGSMLENCWKRERPGISFGESLKSLGGKQNTGKCVGSLV